MSRLSPGTPRGSVASRIHDRAAATRGAAASGVEEGKEGRNGGTTVLFSEKRREQRDFEKRRKSRFFSLTALRAHNILYAL
jgi:hypothetical protein